MKKSLRFLFLVVILIILVIIYSRVSVNLRSNFDVPKLFILNFATFTLLGAIASFTYINPFDRDVWVNIREYQQIPIIALLLFISLTYVLEIGFMMRILSSMKVGGTIGLAPVQFVLGMMIISLFTKD